MHNASISGIIISSGNGPGSVKAVRTFMPNAEKLLERLQRFPPEMRYREVEVILEAFGWAHDRTSGSHHIWVKPGRDILDIVVHNKMVKTVDLKKIARML
jgi:predicted RNA binding protein YcfA (HicA-like mRNA interferase family)